MIIKSLLDNDFYKLTMAQAVLHQFPDTTVRYKFKSRGEQKLGFLWEQVLNEVNLLSELKLQLYEKDYLHSLGLFKSDFVDFLRIFRFNPSCVYVSTVNNGQDLEIEITGPWIQTILYEVPLLSIVSELYSKSLSKSHEEYMVEGHARLDRKLESLELFSWEKPITFADFGTRRRFSSEWQEQVVVKILDWQSKLNRLHLVGTSNVYLAMMYGIKPIGTMAHEWLQAGQGMNVRLDQSQKHMLETWCQEYRGKLGIALTDVISMDAFLKDFDLYFSKLFDGCRHDSGDPYHWCEKLISHYKSLNIDPKTKTAVFSDGLDFQKMIDLAMTFNDKINTSFGIGTNLTNDLGIDPLKIVIKMVECNGYPVAKISDTPGKSMCEDQEYLKTLTRSFRIK